MSSPSTFSRYADAWVELLVAWEANPEKIISINCGTEKKAKAMRLEFYKMREAAMKDPLIKERYANALDTREVKVKDTMCIFDHKGNNWVQKLIEENMQQIQGEE